MAKTKMMLALEPEACHHQWDLQSTTQAFIATMRSDDHEAVKYTDFIKDMKFLLDNHISEL